MRTGLVVLYVLGAALAVPVAYAQGPTSPFDNKAFDPDRAPVPEATVEAGKAEPLALFVPYPAREEGLKIRLRLEGKDSGLLKVYLRVDSRDRPVAGHGGQFDIVVPKGETQALLWLLWDGQGATGEPITVSSTIVDRFGTPTHITRIVTRAKLGTRARPLSMPRPQFAPLEIK